MKQYFLFLIIIALMGCRNNDKIDSDINKNQPITEYNPIYMDYNNIAFFKNFDLLYGKNVKIEYKGSKISKRITDLVFTNNQSIVLPYKTMDSIWYHNNEINILTVDLKTKAQYKYKKIFLDGSNISKIIVNNNGSIDTLKFQYRDKLLDKITVYDKGIKSITKFYFNNKKNIDSAVTKYGDFKPISNGDYVYIFDASQKQRKKQIFLDFDRTPNPLKNLILFDETFNRSLSNNNYKSYKEYWYDNHNNIAFFTKKKWDFTYENNKINFAK